MGKSSNEVKETEAEKAAAEVAKEQWQTYQTDLKPYENLFMAKVEDMNSEDQYDKLAGATNLGYSNSFGKAREQTAQGLASAGVDPTSGKYQATMDGITSDQTVGLIDATNRAQSSQQDKYVAGLKDIQSIGQGQKAEALQGYDNIASNSLRKSVSDASASAESRQNIAGTVGSAAGMGLNYYLHQPKEKPETPEIDTTTKKPFTGGF